MRCCVNAISLPVLVGIMRRVGFYQSPSVLTVCIGTWIRARFSLNQFSQIVRSIYRALGSHLGSGSILSKLYTQCLASL